MSMVVQPVIMAGGAGTRLWPLSRAGHPKQFLVLSGDPANRHSLFQQAVLRLQGLGDAQINVAAPTIVGNEEHRFLVLDQLQALNIEPAAALLEPVGRNTAPAVTLAALAALDGGADPVLVYDDTIKKLIILDPAPSAAHKMNSLTPSVELCRRHIAGLCTNGSACKYSFCFFE